ncbi:MAG: hypothetical protein IBX69_07420 [Anaerolineales bacterium]|nr:hypothetical protein [Anaerolineales bacterium]
MNNKYPINRARSRLKIVSGQVSLLLLVTVLLVSGWHALDTKAVGHAAELEIDGSWELARTSVAPEAALPNLNAFVRSVQNGSTGTLAGVYVPGKWAYSISQQPPSNPGFVSSNPEAVTQFGLAAQYNTIGLLAHNYLAGSSFFELDKSNKAALIYGDGSVKYFLIEGIDRYRALSPNSPYSSFEDLQNPGVIISVTELFNRIYAPGDRLVLQTCIESNGNLSWGRLFITASPIDYPVKISYNYRPEKFRLD